MNKHVDLFIDQRYRSQYLSLKILIIMIYLAIGKLSSKTWNVF